MKPGSILALACIGAAVILLMKTEKGHEISEEIADNAGKWGKKIKKLANDAGDQAEDLTSVIAKQIKSLGNDARDRVMAIIDESLKTGNDMKNKAKKQLAM